MPYGRNPKKWFSELQDEIKNIGVYDVSYVICTRDLSISRISRQKRFGGSMESYLNDDIKARNIFSEIMKTNRYYIFSLESALALQESYYQDFYKWLNIESNFMPPVFDVNLPYIHPKNLN